MRIINFIQFALFFLLASAGQMASAETKDFAQFKAQFKSFAEKERSDFQSYKINLRKELARYKAQITGVWGYADVNSGSRLVVYSQDLNEKVLINYTNDEIFYSSVKPSDIKKAEILLRNTLNTPVSELKHGKSMVSSIQLLKFNPSKGLTIADSLGIERNAVEALANSIAKESKPVKEYERVKQNIKALEAAKRQVEHFSSRVPIEAQQPELMYLRELNAEQAGAVRYQAALITKPEKAQPVTRKVQIKSTRWKKAAPYRQYVQLQSHKYKIPPSLLFAIMETESSFNPMAQSLIPAFGLMQVVPTSAGVDVNQYLYKNKTPPKKRKLLEPEFNVEFGSTYMNLLMNRYFRQVEDDTSRLYVSIAAYNTGPGNVAKVFNDGSSTKLKKAYPRINHIPPEQVYEKLRAKAHPETQNYIRKVVEAQKYYEKFI